MTHATQASTTQPMPGDAGLAGKVVAITGASSGIGRACALRLAGSGAHVALGARREEPLKDLVHEIERTSEKAVHAATDVRNSEDLKRLVRVAQDRFGRLDVLVSNAGIMPISPMPDLRVTEWDDMVDVNLRGILHGIAAALPIFLEQGLGHFVTMSSTATLQARPAMAVYAGTKAAVTTISEWMRQELTESIRATTIYPGMTDTDFAGTMTNEKVREQLETRRRTQSLNPDAIARAVSYAIAQPDDVEISDIVVRPRSSPRQQLSAG